MFRVLARQVDDVGENLEDEEDDSEMDDFIDDSEFDEHQQCDDLEEALKFASY